MKTKRNNDLQKLQKNIAYPFKNTKLLDQALTHRSYHAHNNERLEFIGDAILDYVIAKMLFDTFPQLPEGKLSRLRANLVNQDVLAQIAQGLNIGDVLLLGPGELKSGGFNRPSILSDALEALFAAISLDADFYTASQVIVALYQEKIKKININDEGKDPKTLLQELLQSRKLRLPQYRIIHHIEDSQNQQFEIECCIDEPFFQTTAIGSNRRIAERLAAEKVLQFLNKKLQHKKSS